MFRLPAELVNVEELSRFCLEDKFGPGYILFKLIQNSECAWLLVTSQQPLPAGYYLNLLISRFNRILFVHTDYSSLRTP